MAIWHLAASDGIIFIDILSNHNISFMRMSRKYDALYAGIDVSPPTPYK